MALREPIGDAANRCYLVTDEVGALYVAFEPSEQFRSDEPDGAFVCLSEPADALTGLLELRAAVDNAIAALSGGLVQ